jgi:hypothetical protein
MYAAFTGTYYVLAKGEWYVVAIAMDLHENRAVPAEFPGDSGLNRTILFVLGKGYQVQLPDALLGLWVEGHATYFATKTQAVVG